MLISSKSEYGLRALIDIASSHTGEPVGRSGIAQRQQIPLPFLTQVLRSLVSGGLLVSTRGPAGGYSLSKPAKEISILEVIKVLQGRVAPASCGGASEDKSCGFHDGCGLAGVWSRLQSVSEDVLGATSLNDIVSGNIDGATAVTSAPFSEAPSRKLDCIGDACPLPIVRIAQEMRNLEPMDILEVWADDEGSKADIPAWCTGTGNEFIGREEFGSQMKFMIRKRV